MDCYFQQRVINDVGMLIDMVQWLLHTSWAAEGQRAAESQTALWNELCRLSCCHSFLFVGIAHWLCDQCTCWAWSVWISGVCLETKMLLSVWFFILFYDSRQCEV